MADAEDLALQSVLSISNANVITLFQCATDSIYRSARRWQYRGNCGAGSEFLGDKQLQTHAGDACSESTFHAIMPGENCLVPFLLHHVQRSLQADHERDIGRER